MKNNQENRHENQCMRVQGLAEGRSVLRLYPLSLARWLARRHTIQLGDCVRFDFHERRYRQLTGIVIKINDHSYLVRLHERHLKAIQEVFEYREGNGCVCVSQKLCRKQ